MSDNDKWAHAQSLEGIMKERDMRAQLDFMRDLFENHLPVMNDGADIQNKLNQLEEDIKRNGGSYKHDNFPDDDENAEREYYYHSSTLFKQRAGLGGSWANEVVVDDSAVGHQQWSPTPSDSSEPPPLSPVSER